MDLHALAESDLAFTLEGNGQTVKITNPSGVSENVQAISNDISLLIDPETGVPVSGRNVNVAFRMSSLINAGLGIPKGIEDANRAPWVVESAPVGGGTIKTKIMATNPDRAIGIITCSLELVK